MDALSYLESRCSLRRNVLTGEISYAPHRSNDYKPLSKEGINTLILEAGRDGVALTETLMNRYVNSCGTVEPFRSMVVDTWRVGR